MKKNILMYLYILLIAGATFLLVPVFKVMGSTNFLEDNREVFEANDYDLMSGTTLSFRNNGTSSYIKKEALFSQAYESKNEFGKVLYKFSLDIYAATEKKGSKYQDGFFLLVKDIHIDHPNIILDEDGRNLIRFVMEFDKPVIYKDKELKSSEDIFVPLYDGKSGILFFDQSLLKNNDGFVEVKKMTLSVVTNQEVSIDLLNLYNYDLDPEIKEDMFDEGHNRDIKNVSSTNINSFKKYGADGLNYSGEIGRASCRERV